MTPADNGHLSRNIAEMGSVSCLPSTKFRLFLTSTRSSIAYVYQRENLWEVSCAE
jgi:hypothetical protein